MPGVESTLLTLIALLRENLTQPLKLPDIAHQLGCHPRTLQRYIKNLDHNYSSLLRALRIEEAAKLIAKSDQNMLQIAKACGYHDRSHLHRDFLRIVGVSPRQYRYQARNHRKKSP